VIDELPEDGPEVFDLTRIPGLTQAEVVHLRVSAATTNRWLGHSLRLLAKAEIFAGAPVLMTNYRGQMTMDN
jgi:hypothetical protein